MMPPAFGGGVFGPPLPGYGAAGLEAPEAPDFVGGETSSKGIFLRHQRRRINFVPVIGCILLPWGLYAVMCAVMAFSLHYELPSVAYLALAGGFISVLIVACVAANQKTWTTSAEREPSWLVFLAGSMLVAFLAAVYFGNSIFTTNMQPYYDVMNLNNYSNIYPDRMRGQQLMDAGRIEFTAGTKLDLYKSMGFKNGRTYCVAPIVLSSGSPVTFDFWAVGVDCCSGSQADFHCGNFDDPLANGGLRLMTEGDRPLYRLAVQQAEATYKIKAVHPLFFEWMADPTKVIEGWRSTGQSSYVKYAAIYLAVQVFAVVAATLAFSKIGS